MANNNNPRNENSTLFKQLTRLFSGPIVSYDRQSARQLRRQAIEKNKNRYLSLSGQEFKKSSHDPFRYLHHERLMNRNRAERYIDFDQMEYEPIISTALDIYADEITTSTSLEDVMQIECDNERIRSILYTLYYDILNVKHNLYPWTRTMCKYGDFFLYLDIDKQKGVTSTLPLPTREIERMEGQDETNPNYIQFQWNARDLTFERWQVAHFRILGNDKYTPYGSSVLENSRRIWRQLCVASDSAVLTTKGNKQIQNIQSGDKVYAFDPEEKEIVPTEVIECRNMGQQDVYKVRTRKRSIKATANHGLLTYTNETDNWEYKKVEDIKTGKYGDRLALPVNNEGVSTYTVKMPEKDYRVKLEKKAKYPSQGIMKELRSINSKDTEENLHNFLQGNRKISYEDFKKLQRRDNGIEFEEYKIYPVRSKNETNLNKDLEFEVDEEFCRFLGFWLGDGWAYESNNQIGFALGEYEWCNEKYEDLLEEHFNGTKSIHEAGNDHGGQVNINSAEAIKIMKALDFISGADKKKVPEWIFEMDLECRREFVRGYFDADGGDSDGRVTSINEELLKGIQTLCYMSGIPADEIKQDREEQVREFPSGESLCSASYRMNINMNEERWYDDYQLQKVLDIELAEENAETYDLQVENDLHNFVVEGIVSHNTLLEDAVMAYRIVRSPERRVFYIDVGGIEPDEVEQFIQNTVTEFKRHTVIDDDTGQVDLRYDPMSIEEDYYIPVRGGESQTRIEKLQGGEYTGDIDDIEYLRDKLFTALKIPQPYLTSQSEGSEEQTTLAQKDIRFARTIQRLQRAVVSELRKVGVVHLYTLGFTGEDLMSFNLKLNNPSQIAEMQQLEHWRTKLDVGSMMKEQETFSDWYVAENVYGLSEDEFIRNRREKMGDAKYSKELVNIEEGGEELGGAEGFGGPLGGEGGGEDIEDFGDEPFGGEEEPADEGGLLTAPEGAEEPAKRDDEGYETPRSKGKKYKPETSDKRDMGARKRSEMAKGGGQSKARSRRKKIPGLSGLDSLSSGIYEEDQKEKKKQKQELLSENISQTEKGVNNLIESLEDSEELNIITEEQDSDET